MGSRVVFWDALDNRVVDTVGAARGTNSCQPRRHIQPILHLRHRKTHTSVWWVGAADAFKTKIQAGTPAAS